MEALYTTKVNKTGKDTQRPKEKEPRNLWYLWITGRKNRIINKWCWKKGYPYGKSKTQKLCPLHTPQKSFSHGLRHKYERQHFQAFRRKYQTMSLWPQGRERFVKQDAKSTHRKEKADIFNYIKLENVSTRNLYKVRRQAIY